MHAIFVTCNLHVLFAHLNFPFYHLNHYYFFSGFAVSQDNKSEEVETDARCYRKPKNARSGSQPSTTMSWGGGGAAGVSTSTGSGRGRGRMGGGGRTKGWKAVPPAWALAAAQNQNQEQGQGQEKEI